MTTNQKVLIGTALGITGVAIAATAWAVNKYFPEYIPSRLTPTPEPLPHPPVNSRDEKLWKREYITHS